MENQTNQVEYPPVFNGLYASAGHGFYIFGFLIIPDLPCKFQFEKNNPAIT